MLDQRTNPPQAGFERREYVRRFLRDVQKRFEGIGEPLFFGCGLSAGWKKRSHRGAFISQELGCVCVPPLDGGRFRRMPDIVFASLRRCDSEKTKVFRLKTQVAVRQHSAQRMFGSCFGWGPTRSFHLQLITRLDTIHPRPSRSYARGEHTYSAGSSWKKP